MSQDTILKFLKENKSKFTAAQIIYFLRSESLSSSVIYSNLSKLRNQTKKGVEQNFGWIWGNYLTSKGRPARYYFYKKEERWKKLTKLLQKS